MLLFLKSTIMRGSYYTIKVLASLFHRLSLIRLLVAILAACYILTEYIDTY